MEKILILVLILPFSILALRRGMIDSFKVGYYETKLKNRGVDISHIEKMSFLDIFRL